MTASVSTEPREDIEVRLTGPARRLAVTTRARLALARVIRTQGPQAFILSWPAGATYLPVAAFQPDGFAVIVGHIAGCPIYADVRQIAFYRDRRAVLDIPDGTVRERPVLRLRLPHEVPVAHLSPQAPPVPVPARILTSA
jgi:hypothetical protein